MKQRLRAAKIYIQFSISLISKLFVKVFVQQNLNNILILTLKRNGKFCLKTLKQNHTKVLF